MITKYTTHSDEQILAILRAEDDRKAFEELYFRYFKILYNYISPKVNDRYVAQDILQELFVSLWQKRHISDINNCKQYLFSASKNLIINHYRKELVRQRQNTEWEISRPKEANSTLEHTLAINLENRYEEGLDILSPKCREVFVLSRKGYTNREVASQLAISEKNVEQHISKALKTLRVHLREHLVYTLIIIQLF